MNNAKPLDKEKTKMYMEIYKERLDRETYTHGILWKEASMEPRAGFEPATSALHEEL